jgi:hypothetical protein
MTTATIEGATVQRQTARAVLVEAQGRAVWLPLALVTLSAAGALTLPAWLATDRGLTVEPPAPVATPAPLPTPPPRRYVSGYVSRGYHQRQALAADYADDRAPRGSAGWRRAYGQGWGGEL